MGYELIITEKPNAAKMIAAALADGKPIKESYQGVPYYKVTHGKNDIVIGCAVGHLYTVAEKEKSFKYPVFDLQWKESGEIDAKSFTKKYVAALKKLAKGASAYTVATDYDIEGEVIGLNCVRYICKQKDAARMKFSTLTKDDLIESYAHKSKTLDWGQAIAGETRHYLDWMYGINLSRALTLAMKNAGIFKILSSGRVQGPALKLIVDKEEEIAAFKPEPYWEVQANVTIGKHPELVQSWHTKGKFSDEKEARAIAEKVQGKDGVISGVQKNRFIQKAPVPFDLTTLQMESYRLFGIKPRQTLDIAQELYTGGFISYPRTSSQKLPKEINYKKIMDALAKQPSYTPLVAIASRGPLIPSEGKKTDPAHPAIYPTGAAPKLKDWQFKIYDLIVKRFLSCFGSDATRETVTLTINIVNEPFQAKGTRTVEKGWHALYAPYVKLEEEDLPLAQEKDVVHHQEVIVHDKETQPPRRYTPASIIKELERQELGTKATRAAIVDSLYDRNYIKNESIEATELGIKTVQTLEKYCPEILDEGLTRHFEQEMDGIREKKFTEEKVLAEAESTLTTILTKFKKNEKPIGEALTESHKESMRQESELSTCPLCKEGKLAIRYSKISKRKFIGCTNYPTCTALFNLPVFGIPKKTDKICPQCQFPIIKILNGRKTKETCINVNCPSKKVEDEALRKEIEELEAGTLTKTCPKCAKPLVLRKSMYGQFLGCSAFPKCRHIERIGGPARKHAQKDAAAKKDADITQAKSKSAKKTAATSISKKSTAKKSSKTASPKKSETATITSTELELKENNLPKKKKTVKKR